MSKKQTPISKVLSIRVSGAVYDRLHVLAAKRPCTVSMLAGQALERLVSQQIVRGIK